MLDVILITFIITVLVMTVLVLAVENHNLMEEKTTMTGDIADLKYQITTYEVAEKKRREKEAYERGFHDGNNAMKGEKNPQ